jgi:predicted metal-binding protein
MSLPFGNCAHSATLKVQASEDVDVSTSTSSTSASTSVNDHNIDPIFLEQAKKFKIITCTSITCCQRRRNLGLDSLSTFGSMYSRAKATGVQVEEGPCVGSCKKAPCIAIEHDEFDGYVALEGMSSMEFSTKA